MGAVFRKWMVLEILIISIAAMLSCNFVNDVISSDADVYWPMRSDDGFGLMNCVGEWVVEPMGRQYNPFMMIDGVAPVLDYDADEYMAGIIDSEGNFIVEQKFLRAWPYSDGYALVETEDGFRFIDSNGEYLFRSSYPITYQILPVFGNGMVNVSTEVREINSGLLIPETMIYIDSSGDQVLGPYRQAYPFSDGFAEVIYGEGQDTIYAYIDTEGKVILEFSIDENLSPAGLYSEGLFPVMDTMMRLEEGKCSIGFMNAEKEWVIEPQFCKVGRFVDGLAPAAVDMIDNSYYYGYINTEGDWVIAPDYDMNTPNEFSGGCTLVYWDNFRNAALLDTEGDIIYSYEQ